MLAFYLSLLDTEEEKSKFTQLYVKYGRLMKFIARHKLKDDYLAEDALHNAFIKLTRYLHTIEEIDCHKTKRFVVIVIDIVVTDSVKALREPVVRFITEEKFSEAVSEYSKKALQLNIEARQRELKSLTDRGKELDKLFERLYEDNVSGKISDERFHKMSAKYEGEQAEIVERAKTLRNLLEELSCKSVTTDKFVATVKNIRGSRN